MTFVKSAPYASIVTLRLSGLRFSLRNRGNWRSRGSLRAMGTLRAMRTLGTMETFGAMRAFGTMRTLVAMETFGAMRTLGAMETFGTMRTPGAMETFGAMLHMRAAQSGIGQTLLDHFPAQLDAFGGHLAFQLADVLHKRIDLLVRGFGGNFVIQIGLKRLHLHSQKMHGLVMLLEHLLHFGSQFLSPGRSRRSPKFLILPRILGRRRRCRADCATDPENGENRRHHGCLYLVHTIIPFLVGRYRRLTFFMTLQNHSASRNAMKQTSCFHVEDVCFCSRIDK